MPTVQGGTFIYAPCLTFQVDLMDRSLNIYISTGPYYVLLEEAHTPFERYGYLCPLYTQKQRGE